MECQCQYIKIKTHGECQHVVLQKTLTKSATDFAINKAAGAMKDAAKELVDESANFLQEVLDKTDDELTGLTTSTVRNIRTLIRCCV